MVLETSVASEAEDESLAEMFDGSVVVTAAPDTVVEVLFPLIIKHPKPRMSKVERKHFFQISAIVEVDQNFDVFSHVKVESQRRRSRK